MVKSKEQKIEVHKSAIAYAEKLGEGGYEIANAIMAAFCAGRASAAKTAEKSPADAGDKKEG